MKLLLVEDNPAVAAIMIKLLRARDHDVCHVDSGEAALDVARTYEPELVLMDMGLPDVDGYAVATALRSDGRFDNTILVAHSGYAAEEDRARSKAAGFDAHFAKPMDFDELPRIVARRSRDANSSSNPDHSAHASRPPEDAQ